MDNRPIGILDSGIGGLTIARGVNKLMPNEQILFFGDTAHLPYGDKSAKAIRGYVNRISEFLLEKDCKMVLIACNSASAAAYEMLHRKHGKDYIIINVIDPIVDWVCNHMEYKKIGVIGTKRTIQSRVYAKKIESLDPELEVKSLATPLLAPMIEEGFFNNNISQTIINSYLSNKKLDGIEALILACTHYPLIKKEIETYYNGSVDIIDSTEVVAQFTYNALKEKGMLASEARAPEHHFCVSDFTNSFQKTTQIFFGKQIKLEHSPIWKEA